MQDAVICILSIIQLQEVADRSPGVPLCMLNLQLKLTIVFLDCGGNMNDHNYPAVIWFKELHGCIQPQTGFPLVFHSLKQMLTITTLAISSESVPTPAAALPSSDWVRAGVGTATIIGTASCVCGWGGGCGMCQCVLNACMLSWVCACVSVTMHAA